MNYPINLERLNSQRCDNFRVQLHLPDQMVQAICYLFMFHINKYNAVELRDSCGTAIQSIFELEFRRMMDYPEYQESLRRWIACNVEPEAMPQVVSWIKMKFPSWSVDKPVGGVA